MQRTIKFRAWDVDDGCWASLFDGVDPSDGRPFYVDPDGVREFQVCENYTVMQYTGLKDKNGVEIYEGDVIERGARWHDGLPFDEPVIDIVKFGDYGWLPWAFTDSDIGSVKVIGNIYENPDLLTQEETTHGN